MIKNIMYEYQKTEDVDMQYFYIISYIFICIFVYYAIKLGMIYGFHIAFFIWCTTVCTTPISTASVLLSFPVKIFTNIPMFITKIIISILSLFVVIYYYQYKREMINTIPVGRAITTILNNKLFSIFLIASLSSVLSSYILNYIVDVHFLKIKILDDTKNNSAFVLSSVSVIFLILNYIYMKLLVNNNIVGFNKKHYFL